MGTRREKENKLPLGKNDKEDILVNITFYQEAEGG